LGGLTGAGLGATSSLGIDAASLGGLGDLGAAAGAGIGNLGDLGALSGSLTGGLGTDAAGLSSGLSSGLGSTLGAVPQVASTAPLGSGGISAAGIGGPIGDAGSFGDVSLTGSLGNASSFAPDVGGLNLSDTGGLVNSAVGGGGSPLGSGALGLPGGAPADTASLSQAAADAQEVVVPAGGYGADGTPLSGQLTGAQNAGLIPGSSGTLATGNGYGAITPISASAAPSDTGGLISQAVGSQPIGLTPNLSSPLPLQDFSTGSINISGGGGGGSSGGFGQLGSDLSAGNYGAAASDVASGLGGAKTLLPLGLIGMQSLMQPSLTSPQSDSNQIQSLANQLQSITPQTQNIATQAQSNANSIIQQGQGLIQPISTGVLPSGWSSQVSTALNDAITSTKSKFAAMGMSGSTMENSEIANLQQQSQIQSAQLAQNLANTGLQELQSGNQYTTTGLNALTAQGNLSTSAASLYQQLLNSSLQQDQALQNSITNFASAAAGGGSNAAVTAALLANQGSSNG
jgi:hypothetical protein